MFIACCYGLNCVSPPLEFLTPYPPVCENMLVFRDRVIKFKKITQFSSVQSLSCVQLFAITWSAVCQTSLSITNSQSLLKLMSIDSVTPSNHLILCCSVMYQEHQDKGQLTLYFVINGHRIRYSIKYLTQPLKICY